MQKDPYYKALEFLIESERKHYNNDIKDINIKDIKIIFNEIWAWNDIYFNDYKNSKYNLKIIRFDPNKSFSLDNVILLSAADAKIHLKLLENKSELKKKYDIQDLKHIKSRNKLLYLLYYI